MKINKISLVFISVWLLSNISLSTEGIDFFAGRSGPRALALGGAYTSLADDYLAPFWNPAGLTKINQFGVASDYLWQYEDVSRISLASAFNLGDQSNFFLDQARIGVSLIRESVGDILLTSSANNSYGKIDGSYSDMQLALGLSYAKPLTDSLSFGLTGKYYSHSHYIYSASGLGLDIGIIGQISSEIGFGIVWKNMIQPTLKWDTSSKHQDTLARSLIVGINYQTKILGNRVIFASDLDLSEENSFKLGIETEFTQYFKLRAGIANELWSLGCGLKLFGFTLDYSYRQPDLLGNEQHLSLGVKL